MCAQTLTVNAKSQLSLGSMHAEGGAFSNGEDPIGRRTVSSPRSLNLELSATALMIVQKIKYIEEISVGIIHMGLKQSFFFNHHCIYLFIIKRHFMNFLVKTFSIGGFVKDVQLVFRIQIIYLARINNCSTLQIGITNIYKNSF